MKGRLKDLGFDRDGNQFITVTTRSDFTEMFDRLKDADVDIEIKKHFEKRSNDANAYCWKLCELIADELSNEDVKMTKNEVYREAIRAVGVYRDFHGIAANEAPTLIAGWGRIDGKKGVGWVSEIIDYSADGEKVDVRCYYGSSTYNTKQMARLIDNLVQDAEALGIPTETPEEIEKMKSLWKQERK